MLTLSGLVLILIGCGKTTTKTATEQLLTSNAVDRVVAQMDFTPLAGQKVYFDDQYIRTVKSTGVIGIEYIISSIRQQIMAANCLIQDRKEDAEYIIEARVGALGNDDHEVSYGIPANNLLSSASSIVPTAPAVPAIPEISLAKKQHHVAAAKIGVFAYHRETKQPVWQSGVIAERSRAKEAWFMGVGPYQTGTIYKEPMFAGAAINRPVRNFLLGKPPATNATPQNPTVNYVQPHLFPMAQQLQEEKNKPTGPQNELEWANHEQTQKTLHQLIEQTAEQKPAAEPPKAEEKKQ